MNTVETIGEWELGYWGCQGFMLPAVFKPEADGWCVYGLRFWTDEERDEFFEREWLSSLDDDGIVSSD